MKKLTSHSDACTMRVTLKRWSKSSLARDDYDFSGLGDWPKHALNMAFFWELEREMGSSRGPIYPAWQIHELTRILAKLKSDNHFFDGELLPANFPKTGKGVKAAIESLEGEIKAREKAYFDDRRAMEKSIWLSKAPLSPRPMLNSHLLTEVSALVRPGTENSCKEVKPDALMPGDRNRFAYTRIHALEIDWTKTESGLMDAFRNWLRDGEHKFSPGEGKGSTESRGGRNTAGLLSYLRDLAIYRIGEARITHKEGLKMLGLRMSAQNWEHAQARTKEKICRRIAQLCHCANLQAVGGGKEGYWKDMFIDWDSLDDPPCV